MGTRRWVKCQVAEYHGAYSFQKRLVCVYVCAGVWCLLPSSVARSVGRVTLMLLIMVLSLLLLLVHLHCVCHLASGACNTVHGDSCWLVLAHR